LSAAKTTPKTSQSAQSPVLKELPILARSFDEGITNFDHPSLLKVQPISQLGTALEIVKAFGGKPQYQAATQALAQALYQAPSQSA
jgi:hypothetical protein